jgi:predicted GIY-YIG superfamily endonuclease
MTPPAVRHYVYRCYDADDRLLYIGCTEDLVSRFAVHASSWSNPVSGTLNLRMVRHTVEEFPDKASGRKAEREAIYNEAPLLNLHHQRVKVTPAQRRALIDAYLDATQREPDPEIARQLNEIGALFARRSA